MKLIFLGTGQDAGVPQIGCNCFNCENARGKDKYKRLGPSIALLDEKENFCYFFDASPDLKQQVTRIQKYLLKVKTQARIPISGIFLTHAHFGHVAGLWSLGKECSDTRDILVYCSTKMTEFLKTNHPFKHLLERKNIKLFSMKNNHQYPINNFQVNTFQVPHRNEYADTVGFIISTATKKILYLPDIDEWTDEVITKIAQVDLAIIDGTFYSQDELPNRSEVPHPPIKESMERLKNLETEIYFTHFNHTNPILDENSKERKNVVEKGFKIAFNNQIINI